MVLLPQCRRIQKRGQGHVPTTRGHPVRPVQERKLQRGQRAQSLSGPAPPTQSWHRHEPACSTGHKHTQTDCEVQLFLPHFSHEKITNCEISLLFIRSFILFIPIFTILNWLFPESFDLSKLSTSQQPWAAGTIWFQEPSGKAPASSLFPVFFTHTCALSSTRC